MNIMSNFVKEVIARIKGDDAEVIAARNERKANSAFKQQLAVLESEIVEAEIKVGEREEAYHNALYPTKPIDSTLDYLQEIVATKNELEDAQENLEILKESVEFFTKEKKKVFGSKS